MPAIDLLETSDARAWAQEFVRIYHEKGIGDDPEGWMIGWFANAIERGRMDSAAELARAREHNREAAQALLGEARLHGEIKQLKAERDAVREIVEAARPIAKVGTTNGHAFVNTTRLREAFLNLAEVGTLE